MARKESVAPKERINIVYRPATSANEVIELPLKMLVVADVTGVEDDRPLEERKPVKIDKDNFNSVMESFELGCNVSVPDKLSGESDQELVASLQFKTLRDFTPDGLVKQVPELNRLLELRKALSALKSPIGNRKEFRNRIRDLIDDDSSRQQLLRELGLEEKAKS